MPARAAAIAIGWVKATDVNLVMPAQLVFLTQEQKNLTGKTIAALEQYLAEQQSRSGKLGTSFWIYQEVGQSSTDEGRLTKGDLKPNWEKLAKDMEKIKGEFQKVMDAK